MVILTSSSNNSIKQATIRKRNANINKTAISRVRSAWKKGFEAIKRLLKLKFHILLVLVEILLLEERLPLKLMRLQRMSGHPATN